jgi:branched-chain amino acid transport system permease protein
MCFTSNFWTLLIGGLADGFIYALIALGYTLVYGVLRLINFAHSEVFMSGAFGGLFVLQNLIGSKQPAGLDSVGLVAVGTAAAAVTGGAGGLRAREGRLPTSAPPQRAPPGVPH